MTELVHEDVRRPDAVGRNRAVETEDASATVGGAVRQNLDEFVRRVRGDVAERLVLEGQHVALGIERVVGGADRRLPVDVLRRSRDPRLRGRWTETPDVDVGLPLPEGRSRQQRGDQPASVALELGPFARGVAVAENQDVQLRRGIAALMQRDQSARIRGRYRRDELVRGIDGHRPRVAEEIAGIALLDDDANRRARSREPQRFGKRPVDLLGLARRLPLAVDRAEPARVEHASAGGVGDLEQVLAAVGGVDRLRGTTGPRQRLENDPVQAEAFLFRVARVVVVHAHRFWRRGRRGGVDEKTDDGEELHHEAAIARRLPDR